MLARYEEEARRIGGEINAGASDPTIAVLRFQNGRRGSTRRVPSPVSCSPTPAWPDRSRSAATRISSGSPQSRSRTSTPTGSSSPGARWAGNARWRVSGRRRAGRRLNAGPSPRMTPGGSPRSHCRVLTRSSTSWHAHFTLMVPLFPTASHGTSGNCRMPDSPR